MIGEAYLSTQDNLIFVLHAVTVPSTQYDTQLHFVLTAAHNRLHYWGVSNMGCVADLFS